VRLRPLAAARSGRLAVLLLVAAACRAPEPMPLAPSATWLVPEPPVATGRPFELVLFVRVPQGHRVHDRERRAPGDLEILERRVLAPSDEGPVVVHREAMLVRARSPGVHVWPADDVQVTGGDGATYALPLARLELDVPSVFGEGAPPRRPRGYRAAPADPIPVPFAWGFTSGALAAGALAVLLIRRARRTRPTAPAARTRAHALGRRYYGGPGRLREGLAAAQAFVAEDADVAAARAALALRRFAADRFLVATHARDTDALRAACPKGVGEAHWGAWIERLAAIERARFSPGDARARAAAVARAIAAAEAAVDDIDRGSSAPRRGDEGTPS
jgi:hypothetical protein